MGIEHAKVQAGEGLYAVAARIAPKGITIVQRNTFAGQIAAASGLKGPSALVYAGQVLHYHTEDVPAPVVVVPPPPPPPPPTTGEARWFSPTSPWNTPIGAGAAFTDHPILHVMSEPINGDLRRHGYVSDARTLFIHRGAAADPEWTFNLPAINDPVFNRVKPATTLKLRAPATLAAGVDEDHVLALVGPDRRWVEVWQAVVNPTTRVVTGQAWAAGSLDTSPGAGTTTGYNDGTRAANFSWLAGAITGREIDAGVIDHALVIGAGYGVLSNTAWKAPATAPDNGNHDGPLAMGQRLGIPPGVAMPTGLSTLGVMVFKALQTYGAYIGDFVGSPYLMLFIDGATVNFDACRPLFAWWEENVDLPTNEKRADLDRIGPLIRLVD
jgi:hypothetical protein